MKATALLEALQARGVRLSILEGRLRVEAPKGLLTPQDKLTLAERKSELVAALTPWPGPCYCCSEICWWLHKEGGVVCGRCHPPAYPEHVAAWIPQAACGWRGSCH